MDSRQIIQFRRRLLGWYAYHRADLPWRHTHNPYKILVSEIMLQQTQVDRVKIKWSEFLKEFPTITTLAQAPVSRVIQVWKGMGYNRRALYLQKTAQTVTERYHGVFPRTLKELRALPGVGEYTSRALMVFAFNKSYITPDVNVLRILSRSFLRGPSPRGERVGVRGMSERDRKKLLIAIGDKIVTPKNAYDINQALMDLGRTICTAKNPKIDLCPLHDNCIANDSPSVQKKKVEPMFGGVPRRIWRGRIVELVRLQWKIPSDQFLHRLGIQEDAQSQEWVTDVLEKLKNDGLVAIKKGIVMLP